MEVIKKTSSVCPKCVQRIPAKIIAEKDHVYLTKRCAKHGAFKVILSEDREYYTQLYKFHKTLNHDLKNQIPKVYNLFVTMDCNLNCPICSVSAPRKAEEFSLEEIKKVLKNFKNTQVCLFGGEPTVHPELTRIIKSVISSGNTPILYTNGIKISNINYLKELKKSGLNDVRLQFDGFDDKSYKWLRGVSLLEYKIKALNNLKELGIPTALEVTVAKGINEDQMGEILRYALKQDFIKAIAFFPYRVLGKAKSENRSLKIDSLIRTLEKSNPELISLKKVMNFQKMVYVFNKIFSRKDCFLNHYFIIAKKNKKIIPLDLNLEKLKISQDDSKLKLVFKIIPCFLRRNPIKFLWTAKHDLISMILSKNLSLTDIKKDLVIIGFKDPCDVYTFDYQNMLYCPGGSISKKRGIVYSSSEDNILREKNNIRLK